MLAEAEESASNAPASPHASTPKNTLVVSNLSIEPIFHVAPLQKDKSDTDSACLTCESVSVSSKLTSSTTPSLSSRSRSSRKGEIITLPCGKKVRRVRKSESKKYKAKAESGKLTPKSSVGLDAVPEDLLYNETTTSSEVLTSKSSSRSFSTNELNEKDLPASNLPPKPPLKLISPKEEARTVEEESKDESRNNPPLLVVEVRSGIEDETASNADKYDEKPPVRPITPITPTLNNRAYDTPPQTPSVTSTATPRNVQFSTSPSALHSSLTVKKTQISQSLLARTRSRAEVEAALPTTSTKDPKSEERNPLSSDSRSPSYPNDTLFLKPNLAKKRTKVVQLLVFGLMGIVGGFFGSIFVQSSCNFAASVTEVGQNDNSFNIHLGLWKYSPIDSVFQGYSYCWPYDNSYSTTPPTFSRTSSLIALLTGTFSLGVLWVYLILGITNEFYWTTAVKVLLVSGTCQLFTFTFFLDNVCAEASCSFGPGAYICIICTVIWFVLAYEMHHNAPVSALLPTLPKQVSRKDLMNLELPEMHERLKSAWNRLPFKAAHEDVPSLSGFTKKNQCDRYERMVNDGTLCNNDAASYENEDVLEDHEGNPGSYEPPDVSDPPVV